MAVKISGVLKDGAGKPVQNCTIVLKARRTSTTVVVNTVASENPDEAGRYSMDVEYGQYSVILQVEGVPPSHAGTITVYEDSRPGTLNDFLGAMTEDDARPEVLRRFEVMVDTVARQAAETAGNAQKAGKYAEDAGQVLARVESLAGEVQQHAVSVAESERDIRQLAEDVSQQAGEAERAAEETRENTAQAGQYAQTAQQNVAQTVQNLQEVTEARDAVVQARRGAESVLTAATQQAETAAQQAKSAGDAAVMAAAQAEASAAARNEAVSARDETAGLARDVEAAIPQVNQWLTTATGAAERAEEAVTAAAESAGQAATGAESAMKAREATETLTRRAETAAGRAEEIAGAFNLENASQEKKGIVRLSNATDSESETEAATPLAVKTVMDEAQKKAALDSPAFTGAPTTPTPPDDASGPEIANAAFVRKRLADLVSSSPEALDTLNELAAALGNDPAFSATVMNMLAGKQPLNRVLTALSRLSPAENSFPCFTGDGQCSSSPVSEKGKLLLSQSTAEEMRDVLGISGNSGNSAAGGNSALQSDIYDRTPGRAAMAGSLGFGHIFTEDEVIHFPSKAALLEWVTNATPGRYSVSVNSSEIIPGTGSAGVIDLFFADGMRDNLSVPLMLKVVVFYGMNGELYQATYDAIHGPSLSEWGKININQYDITAILSEATNDNYGDPETGGITLAAFQGGGSNKAACVRRGQYYQGSSLTPVVFSVAGGALSSLKAGLSGTEKHTLPGTYRALSGTPDYTGEGELIIAAFIRIQ